MNRNLSGKAGGRAVGKTPGVSAEQLAGQGPDMKAEESLGGLMGRPGVGGTSLWLSWLLPGLRPLSSETRAGPEDQLRTATCRHHLRAPSAGPSPAPSAGRFCAHREVTSC